jgi:DNA-binding beta-propeller fold protein YncE
VNGTDGTVPINPATHAVVDQIPVARRARWLSPTSLGVTNSGDGTVSQINTAANTVVQTTSVGINLRHRQRAKWR